MIDIPLVNAPIGSTGLNFTPENIPAWVAYIKPQLEDVTGGGSGLNGLVTGYGRIAGADFFTGDVAKPRVPSSPALAIEIPNSTWFVQDKQIVVNETSGFALLVDIPPNMAGLYGYVSVEEVEDSNGVFELTIDPANWFTALQPSLSASGLACIGKVTTNADTVLSIDSSDADVIVPLPVLSKYISGLTAGTGEEGGVVGVSAAEFNAFKIATNARLAAQDAEIASLKSNQNDASPTPLDQTNDTLNGVIVGLAEVNKHAIERLEVSVITANSGHGQDDTPDFSPDTGDELEMPFNFATGEFGT